MRTLTNQSSHNPAPSQLPFKQMNCFELNFFWGSNPRSWGIKSPLFGVQIKKSSVFT